MKLGVEERDRILAALTSEQRDFLQEGLTRGRRTVFANVLARQKGRMVPPDAAFEDIEHLLESWIYIGYTDAGRVTPELKCECGRSLRYQHTVENKKTGEVRKFGIDHLELHTGIDAKTVHEIVSGFDRYDFELDEILLKVSRGWTLEQERLPDFTELPLPADVQRHLELGLPLLDRQIARIRRLNQEAERARPRPLPPVSPAKKEPAMEMLFQLEEEPEVSPSLFLSLELPIEYQVAVLDYLRQGIRSARILCELLIENHGAPDGRFSTDKPKLYPNVCSFIDGTGRAELVEASWDDRVYSYNG